MVPGRVRRAPWVAVLTLLVALTAGFGLLLDGRLSRPRAPAGEASSAARTSGTATSALPQVPTGDALAAVAELRVAGRAPMSGYDRDLFGTAWLDTDRNGCDTRNDVLRRDLSRVAVKAGTHGCLVLTGALADPYTGRTLAFVRGAQTSRLVEVDHVVALADAWQKGAQQWSDARREAFANDPLELLATDGPTNQSKGAGDAATWLPPATSYRCSYVARQVAVKLAWGLAVTAAEGDAMRRVLDRCPGQPLPARDHFVLAPA